MKPEEAIEIIWEKHMDCEDYHLQFDSYPDGYDFGFGQAILIAAQALKEVQQYREIGTVEECREAVEKQNPKKPDYEGDGYADGYMVYDTWICPNCGEKYEVDYDDYKHCPNCGQAIDENLEGMEDE